MTLPSSGQMSIGDIYTEIKNASGTNISMYSIRNYAYGALNHSNYPSPANPYLLPSNTPYKVSDFYGYNHNHQYLVVFYCYNWSDYSVDLDVTVSINGSPINFQMLGIASQDSQSWSDFTIYPYVNGSGDVVELTASANGGHGSIYVDVIIDAETVDGTAGGNPCDAAFHVTNDLEYTEINITFGCNNA